MNSLQSLLLGYCMKYNAGEIKLSSFTAGRAAP